jgi:heterodisulfide reductase subunit B
MVTDQALATLLEGNPDCLVTSCPLCKKTFANKTDTRVMDLAELVWSSVPLSIPEPITDNR